MSKIWKDLIPGEIYYIVSDNSSHENGIFDRDIASQYWNIFSTEQENGTNSCDTTDQEKENIEKYTLSYEIQNVIIRQLTDFDRCCSEYSENYHQKIIECEILSGVYGIDICQDYERLNKFDKNIILTFMKKYQNYAAQEHIFDDVFFALFGRNNNEYGSNERWCSDYSPYSAEKYDDKNSNTIYYFCAAEEDENQYNRRLFSLIKKLFADCTLKIEPIWGKYCFGMLGDPEYEASCPRIDLTQIL